MIGKTITEVRKLAREASQAALVVTRNQFLIETYVSLQEYKQGKTQRHKSAKVLFKKVGI